MPLVANRMVNLKYEQDNLDVARIRVRKAIHDLVSTWNTEPDNAINDPQSVIISKGTKRSGTRARYFLYTSNQESGSISTILSIKIAILKKENFDTPPTGSNSFTYKGLTYTLAKKIGEDND